MITLLSGGALSIVWSVVLAILILLAMITVHEFGHYLAGKALKFKINEFAIGFGPAIFKHKNKRSGELFSVRALPLGGYCAFEGEDEEGDSNQAFNKKAPWKRIIVLIAGASGNYVLAVLLIMISFFSCGQATFKVNAVGGDPAYALENSLSVGDEILKVEGKNIYMVTDIMSALKGKSEGDVVAVYVCRDGNERTVEVTLSANCHFNNYSDTGKVWNALLGSDRYTAENGKTYYSYGVVNHRFAFFETIGRSFGYSFKIAGMIFTVLGELLTGHLSITAFGGPVTTIKITSQVAVQGVQSFLEIAAYIGVNLAVFNLLPIPALDGSKVVFCIIEWIAKKPVPRKIEAIIHAVGFVLILAFAIIIDILQFAGC